MSSGETVHASDSASCSGEAVETTETVGEEEFEGFGGGTLGTKERRYLTRVMRFLVTIQSPEYLRKARREGYSSEEHREGWRLWKLAAGEHMPLEYWFAEQAAGTAAMPSLGLLQAIDAFENTWFPRTRAIIRRVVPREKRDAFEAAFFRELTQQPLGPAVVGSVRTFLQRVDALATSEQPGAREVHATLVARGLDARRVAEVRAQLRQLEEGLATRPSGLTVDPRAIAEAQAQQQEAVEQLHDWFTDWSTTLRPMFGARDQVSLGLATIKRSHGGADEGDEVGDDEAVAPALASARPKG
jgi:hypothetical protein